MFRVLKTQKFDKKIQKLLEPSESRELQNFIENLKEGHIAGKKLTYEFLREKKIGCKRVYFLVYDELKTILLVTASNKKLQQETIDEIKYLLPNSKDTSTTVTLTLNEPAFLEILKSFLKLTNQIPLNFLQRLKALILRPRNRNSIHY